VLFEQEKVMFDISFDNYGWSVKQNVEYTCRDRGKTGEERKPGRSGRTVKEHKPGFKTADISPYSQYISHARRVYNSCE